MMWPILSLILLAALGMQENLEPHTLTQAEPLDDGDAFLLCTDGWWGALTDTQLTGTLNSASTPRDWLVAMRELIIAQAAPGQDNFSAIAVWVSNPAGTAQWPADADATVAAPLPGA